MLAYLKENRVFYNMPLTHLEFKVLILNNVKNNHFYTLLKIYILVACTIIVGEN